MNKNYVRLIILFSNIFIISVINCNMPRDFPERTVRLLTTLTEWEKETENGGMLSSIKRLLNKNTALKAYNELRILLGKPPAHSIEALDKTWLQEVRDEAFPLETKKIVAEQQKHYGHQYSTKEDPVLAASASQAALIEEARLLAGIEKAVIPLTTKKGAAWSVDSPSGQFSGAVALCSSPNLDERLYAVYHELGHIKYNHATTRAELKQQSIKEGPIVYKRLLSLPVYKDVVELVDHYINLGKQHLDIFSDTGRRLLAVLMVMHNRNLPFWDNPTDELEYYEKLFNIVQEKQADLFALENLWKHNHLNTLIWIIDNYGHSEQITADKNAIHPSHILMALYTAGFLVNKGIDINAALREWEEKGECPADIWIERLAPVLPSAKTPGASDFLDAYKQWQEAEQETNFNAWKINRQTEFVNFSPKQINAYLVTDIKYSLGQLLKDPDNMFYNREALYAYNFLRELNQKNAVQSVKSIDKAWLAHLELENQISVDRSKPE